MRTGATGGLLPIQVVRQHAQGGAELSESEVSHLYHTFVLLPNLRSAILEWSLLSTVERHFTSLYFQRF